MYQASDCYIFPGGKDCAIETPLSVLEAMACNLPVITGIYGGLVDLFMPQKGFYYSSNMNELSKAIEEIINNHDDINTRGMVDHMSWEKVSTDLIKIYMENFVQKNNQNVGR